MCCVISSIFFIGPRAGLLIWWLSNPGRFNMVYGNALIPILGTFFFPVTTLAYTLLYKTSFGGLSNMDWVLMIIAVILDLSLYGGGAFSRHKH